MSDVVRVDMRVFVYANMVLSDSFPSGGLSFSVLLEEELVQDEEIDGEPHLSESHAKSVNGAVKFTRESLSSCEHARILTCEHAHV